jgi:hypothetical protein
MTLLGRAREAVRLGQADEVFKPLDFHESALSAGFPRFCHHQELNSTILLFNGI